MLLLESVEWVSGKLREENQAELTFLSKFFGKIFVSLLYSCTTLTDE